MMKAIIAACILTLLGIAVILVGANYANTKSQESSLPVSTANEILISDVKKNNTAQNCWVIYGGRVFDISRKTAQTDSQIQATVCGTALDTLPAGITKDSLAEYQIGILAP
jgi:hypothetical protein